MHETPFSLILSEACPRPDRGSKDEAGLMQVPKSPAPDPSTSLRMRVLRVNTAPAHTIPLGGPANTRYMPAYDTT